MYALPATTESECDERGKGGASIRDHLAFIGCVGWNSPLTAATPVAAISIIFDNLLVLRLLEVVTILAISVFKH
jgi:hypothetical protein